MSRACTFAPLKLSQGFAGLLRGFTKQSLSSELCSNELSVSWLASLQQKKVLGVRQQVSKCWAGWFLLLGVGFLPLPADDLQLSNADMALLSNRTMMCIALPLPFLSLPPSSLYLHANYKHLNYFHASESSCDVQRVIAMPSWSHCQSRHLGTHTVTLYSGEVAFPLNSCSLCM